MNPDSPNASVMDLVSYFEGRQHSTAVRQGHIAQPQAVRPGSAGKLLAMGSGLHNMDASPHLMQQPSTMPSQAPHTPFDQARFALSNTSQSFHRRGAPQHLKIETGHSFAPFPAQGPYAPSAGLMANELANMPEFSPSMLNSPHAQFAFNLGSPAMIPASTPRRRGHARNESQLSIVSLQSNGSTYAQSVDVDRFVDSLTFINSTPSSSPPSSPRKRKSPAKSPQKAKDRPNYLDKAVKRNTGVTEEQINGLIGDPSANDPKNWRCLWEACDHIAARKENIRAHVQTHLGDRQYECPECHADFVRPHDFTRHYTTHVDSRDFKCPDCPQAFNRADALQRHRDRDFCNGQLPPDSPTKIKRVVEIVERKKDVTGRRAKKQALRKQTAAKDRSDSAELSDDFWSSSAGSPDYLTSDTGSPEMIVDGMDNSFQGSKETSQQTITPANFRQQQHRLNQQPTAPATGSKQADDFIRQLFASTQGSGVNEKDDLFCSLSPPASPEEMHSQLPLQEFRPHHGQHQQRQQRRMQSNQRQSHRQQKHHLTPPSSRDSMLDFLSTGGSTQGALTVASGPSLPDLSSASPSPGPFETVNDFDDFYEKLSKANESANDWFDWQGGEQSIFKQDSSNAHSHDFRITDTEQPDWLREGALLSRTDTVSPQDLFAGL